MLEKDMVKDPFFATDRDLCDFYKLKTLNPQDSWAADSSVIYSLGQPQDSGSVDSSYAVLNDLLRQEHMHSVGRKSTIVTTGLPDPLNPRVGLNELLDTFQIPATERYKYYINSKKFNSKLYLKNLHAHESFAELSTSLDDLDRSLQAQSNDLKALVQDNFSKYVRSKNNLDRIYEQFDRYSQEENKQLGTDNLGASVDDAIQEATLRAKPILDTKTKLQNVQATMEFIEENRAFFDIPKKLKVAMRNLDFAQLMVHYKEARHLYTELTVKGYSFPILIQIWSQIESMISSYRAVVWESLVKLKPGETQEQLLPLMSDLLDLSSEESPIVEWFDAKLSTFESNLKEIVSKMFTRIIDLQREVTQHTSDEGDGLNYYLSIEQYVHPSMEGSDFKVIHESDLAHSSSGLCDSVVIIEMWLLIQKYMKLLSSESTQFVAFWEHVAKFLDGTYKTSLLNDKRKADILGTHFESHASYKKFLEFDDKQIRSLKARGEQFITVLCDAFKSFFCASQASLNGQNEAEKETGSPKDYGFLPPNANCLSCLRYLPRIIEPILKVSTELAQLNISPNCIELLRHTDSLILDRSVAAISATKLKDLAAFHTLEDWSTYKTSGKDKYGITRFPEIVCTFQKLSIMTVRNMLFSYEKLPVLNGIYVVTHPSRQLIAGIEVQQIVSMEAVLESVLKDAAKEKENPRTAKTILTLTNLQYVRERIFPEVLQFFDECFETQLGKKNLELFSLLAKMEASIFGNYLSDLKVNLRDILEERFYEINWTNYSSNSFRVGDYMIEVLMVLVSVHNDCFRIGPQLISRIFKESQIFISKYLFEAFKRYMGNLSSDALLQIVVDVQFFLRVMGDSLEKDTQATLMACLQNCFEKDTNRMQRCIEETEPIVSANLEKTLIQFASFK
ncbi:LADA_0G05820g1_1 [Lachancea dasiensis]|uniref:Exocyst complex component SEC5 n=1 Tax=Lachancea dasiensis TaxID=1072105 RepID=A0A1G4JSY1_9SACH|nr:LADA_0G05820g1_1 [Lachancea dasiensis]